MNCLENEKKDFVLYNFIKGFIMVQKYKIDLKIGKRDKQIAIYAKNKQQTSYNIKNKKI